MYTVIGVAVDSGSMTDLSSLGQYSLIETLSCDMWQMGDLAFQVVLVPV